MMKIAFVRTASNILKYGGYNIQEIGLAKALLKYGVSTDVYARFSNVDKDTLILQEGENKVVIRPLKGKQIYREIMYYPTLKNDLLRGNYDMVQLLDDSQMMLPGLFKALKKVGVKTILWQGMYRNFAGKPARMMQIVYDTMYAKILNKYSDLKIAKTSAARDYLLSKKYNNIEVLSVGLDETESEIDPVFESQIKAFKNKYPKILLYIGALEPRRNPLFMLQLIKSMNRKDLGLILIGKGPSREETLKQINELKLSNQVLTFESIPNKNLISVFSLSNIFLLPTNYEIYGMVVMEALLHGLPVLSTSEAGPAYLLSNEVYGKCLDLDINKWSKEITFYLENYISDENKEQRRNYVENNFRWGPIAAKYYDIIYDLVNNK